MVQPFENQWNSINLIENKYPFFFFFKYATYIFGHQEKGHEYYQFKKVSHIYNNKNYFNPKQLQVIKTQSLTCLLFYIIVLCNSRENEDST